MLRRRKEKMKKVSPRNWLDETTIGRTLAGPTYGRAARGAATALCADALELAVSA